MTLETLIASVGVLGALQIGYRMLKNMEARTASGPAVWNTQEDAFSYFEESDTDKAARKMKKSFDLERAKSIMATAEHFAARKMTI